MEIEQTASQLQAVSSIITLRTLYSRLTTQPSTFYGIEPDEVVARLSAGTADLPDVLKGMGQAKAHQATSSCPAQKILDQPSGTRMSQPWVQENHA